VSAWISIDDMWEGKIIREREVAIRPSGQRSEYPRAILRYDQRGILMDYYWSDNRDCDRHLLNEHASIALAILKNHGELTP
jgi:hypothetical protein